MSLCNKLLKICVFFHVLSLKKHFAPELTREQLVSRTIATYSREELVKQLYKTSCLKFCTNGDEVCDLGRHAVVPFLLGHPWGMEHLALLEMWPLIRGT